MDVSHVYVCVRGAWLLPQSYQYQNLSEGADRVSGVTKSGRVWRKVPESGARSVWLSVMLLVTVTMSVIMTKEDEEQDLFDDGDDNGYEVGNVVKRNELVYIRG